MHVQVWDNDPYKLGPAAGQDTSDFVLLIIQRSERIGDFLLILQGEGIRIIEIPGDRRLGKSGVCRNICECHFLF